VTAEKILAHLKAAARELTGVEDCSLVMVAADAAGNLQIASTFGREVTLEQSRDDVANLLRFALEGLPTAAESIDRGPS
jgi:hypothetical protein